MYNEAAQELLSFIKSSPTPFHAVWNISGMLEKEGFERLKEGSVWDIRPGGKYYVTRNGSSILAFKTGTQIENYSFHITASHSDSPTFKLKENAQIDVKGKYTVLNTEGYGGMICSTWFDRPLSLAGRVIVKEGSSLVSRLLNIDRDLLMIPSLAIHMNREVNEKQSLNKQKDMLPVYSGKTMDADALKNLVANELRVEAEQIYGTDLFLYNRAEPSVWGADGEFISSPRLDDLECAYASLEGFLRGENRESVSVYACFDNEEVGSHTKQGAASTFLSDALTRMNAALGKSPEDLSRALASSFMLSCDNAHAVHPNYPEKTDVCNCVYMNEGIVVKSHAGQKYTSDAVSIALFKMICEKAGVPVQFFANRSDMNGGSTLGNIAMSQVSVNTVDIGLAQLAMHSSYETAGIRDADYLIRAVETFYNSHICETEPGVYEIRDDSIRKKEGRGHVL
ncbi:MAG: M18 family aminopeptidase [Lachnospiraceae bacterium]|nr:M18 family aminopeptidase [Lachnospiraceae bacterium]